MKCSETRDRMVFFLAGEDDEVGVHLETCVPCRRHRAPAARERDLFRAAIRAEVRPQFVPRKRLPWWAFAAAGLLVAVVAWLATRAPERPSIEPPAGRKRADSIPQRRKADASRETAAEPKGHLEPEEFLDVALKIERGDVDWVGRRVKARTAARLAWAGATLLLQEGTTLRIAGATEFTLESGAVVMENFGTEFRIRTPHAEIRDIGTRFLVTETEAVVYEGRLRCDDVEAEAGERIALKEKTKAKDASAYPAWTEKASLREVPLLSFSFQGDERHRLYGTRKGGALHGLEKEGRLYTGVEGDGAIVTIPARGEFRVVYYTESAKPVTLRCRALKPDSTAYNFVIEKPVTGRPVSMRVPLSRFVSFRNVPLAPGDEVHILYVFTDDLGAKLRIDDLAIIEQR